MTRVFGDDQRRIGGGEFGGRDTRAFAVGQDGGGPHAQGVLDKFAPMDAAARQSGKEKAVFDLAAVHSQPGDFGIAPALGGERQLAECVCRSAHAPPLTAISSM